MKYKVALVITCTLAFVVVTVTLAGYTGPNRETTKKVRDPDKDKWTLIMNDPPLECPSVCIIYHTCDEHPSVGRQEQVCCGAGSGWRADSSSCEMAFKIVKVKLPPATISSSFNCASPGEDGWCRDSPKLDLDANEPLEGHVITLIEGSLGVLCDPPDDPNVSCSWEGGGEGSFLVDYWAVSSYGDTSEQASDTWRVDTVPPTVSLEKSGGTLGGGGWYLAGLVSLSVSGSDATSGIDSVDLSVDGDGWTQSGQVTGDGIHTVEFRARDHAGNMASETSLVKIDGADPSIGISRTGTLGQNGWFVEKPVRVEALVADSLSGVAWVERRLDGGAWSPGGSIYVTYESVHEVSFRAQDIAGNEILQSTQIRIDTVPPDVNLGQSGGLIGGGGWYLAGPVVLIVNGSDSTSRIESVELSIEGGSWVASSQVTSDGIHSVEIRGSDFAGNVRNDTETVRIDGVAPSIEISKTGAVGLNGWFVGKPVRVEASVSDPLSGVARVESKLDGGTWSVGSLINLTEEGIGGVSFRAVDIAGNEAVQSTHVRIDTVGPLTQFTNPTDGSEIWVSGELTLFGKSTDANSGISLVGLSLNHGETWVEMDMQGDSWSYIWNTLSVPDGTYPVLARAQDMAGNTGTTTRIIVHVENNQPTPILPSPTAISSATATPPTILVTPTYGTNPVAQSTSTSISPTEIYLASTATNLPQIAVVPVKPTGGLVKATKEIPRTRTMGISLRIPWIWPALALIALVTAIGSSKLVDPRPKVLRQIREDLESIRKTEY